MLYLALNGIRRGVAILFTERFPHFNGVCKSPLRVGKGVSETCKYLITKRQTDRAVVSVDSGVNYILLDRGVRYCIGLNSGKPKLIDDNALIGSQQGESVLQTGSVYLYGADA